MSAAPVFAMVACWPLQTAGPSAAATLILDAEPNDTIETALDTEIYQAGEALVIGGEIGNGPLGAADRDLYAFEAYSSHVYKTLLTVSLAADEEGFDGYLRLFNHSGEELVNEDDAEASLNPRLQTYVVEGSSWNEEERLFFIGVSHALNPAYSATDPTTGREAGQGGYTLSILLEPITIPSTSLETANDDPILIESVPATLVNQFIGDGLNFRLDVDRYALNIEVPSIVTAEVRPTQLHLLNPVVGRAYEELRPHVRVRQVEFAVFEPGEVEIAVSGTRDLSEGAAGRSVGFYNFSVDVTPMGGGPLDGPLEPNDSLIEAAQVDLDGGVASFSACIGDGKFGGARGDVDYYEVSLELTQVLEVVVTPPADRGGLQPVLHLFDYWGGHIGSSLPDENGRVHLSFLHPPVDQPQNYVVAVMGTRDRLPLDPLQPYDQYDWYYYPDAVRQANESLDGGPGSKGCYEIVFSAGIPRTEDPAEPSLSGQAVADHLTSSVRDASSVRVVRDLLPSDRVLATRLDGDSDTVVELDPFTGAGIAEFKSPEGPFGGVRGIAFDGTDLFLLGRASHYPWLYRLNPETGTVRSRLLTWF